MRKKEKANISLPSIKFIYPDNYCETYLIDRLAFDEQQVIQGSILFFDDPEPCMIHKGAVISRYIEEICQWVQTIDTSCEHHISNFPKELLKNIDPAIVRDARRFKVFMEESSENQ